MKRFDKDEVGIILEEFRKETHLNNRHITRHELRNWWDNKSATLNEFSGLKELQQKASFVES